MYLALNELSFVEALNDIENQEIAKMKFITFLDFLRDLRSSGICEGVIFSGDIYSFVIWKEYSVASWLKDSHVENTYKQRLRAYVGNFFTYVRREDFESEFIISVQQKDYSGIGCALAAENEEPVLSFEAGELWEEHILRGKRRYLDSDAELLEEETEIQNWTSRCPKEVFQQYHVNKMYEKITSGQDLWECKERLFPNLVFCDNVKIQLCRDSERYHIIRIMNRLQVLQDYFATYDGIYNPLELGFNARTESDSVKNSPDLKRYRLFRKPDGQEEYFFEHISFSGKYAGGRIHFLPSKTEKKCYIGYIGRHLPTKNF